MGLSRLGYMHEYVNHSEGEWVRGECHIINCENRVSILRPWLSIHRGICRDNLKIKHHKPNTSNSRNHKNNSYIITATTFLVKSVYIFYYLFWNWQLKLFWDRPYCLGFSRLVMHVFMSRLFRFHIARSGRPTLLFIAG